MLLSVLTRFLNSCYVLKKVLYLGPEVIKKIAEAHMHLNPLMQIIKSCGSSKWSHIERDGNLNSEFEFLACISYGLYPIYKKTYEANYKSAYHRFDDFTPKILYIII